MTGTGWTIVGSVLVSVLAVVSAVWVALIQRKAAPYPALADRVGRLETQMDAARRRTYRLENDLDVVVDVLHAIAEWDGTPPPPPITRQALDVVHRRRQEREREDQERPS